MREYNEKERNLEMANFEYRLIRVNGIMYDPPLDEGIQHEVEILNRYGIKTYESCESGRGHAFPEPIVRFHRHKEEGFRALAVALQNGLKPSSFRQFWSIIDGEPIGFKWEMTFYR